MTNAERFRRGIAISPSCPMCVRDNETPLHVLRDCSRAQEVWRLILPINTQQVFFSLDLQLWIKSNLVFNTVNPHWCVPRNLIFVSVIWLLWKCHNDFTFNDNALSNAPIASSPISQYPLKWIAPNLVWFYINVDGSVSSNTGMASIRGLSEITMVIGFLAFIA
ncbi:hypothetical protein V6N11_068038 [Hibiscus sabdariffa]|uniref:Reverse transcriptase zinc-binding domain-containing protein n=1 Tax=Hibiscus sabdariffa TaxID=183260 RepID=A0ABR2SSH4_9ROSI